MPIYITGAPYPGPVAENMTFELGFFEDQPFAMLTLFINGPTSEERRILHRDRLNLAILAAPPLTWVVFGASSMAFDAPFGIGVQDLTDVTALRESLGTEAVLGGACSAIVDLICVDGTSGIIFEIRRFSMSGVWTAALARAVLACEPRLDRQAYQSAIDRDQARWRRPSTMLEAATIVETVR